MKERIVILGSDHNGQSLKQMVKHQLAQAGFHCIDVGPYDDRKVDYADYAKTVGKIVHEREAGWGVLMCGTGVGMCIVANRFSNVRAALVHNLETATKSREHNDANLLCLGAWIQPVAVNLEIVRQWFSEKFGEFRHVPRVEKTKEANSDKIVFCPGIFDVLHAGHIQLLRFAKSLGNYLVVGINSDRATRELKGEGRPIYSASDRKAVLDSLEFIDEVVIFDDTKIAAVAAQVNAQIIVKGGEYTAEQVRHRDGIPESVEIKIFPLVSGYSTSSLVERTLRAPIINRHSVNLPEPTNSL